MALEANTPAQASPAPESAAPVAAPSAPEAPQIEAPQVADESADQITEDVTTTGMVYEADEDENNRSDADGGDEPAAGDEPKSPADEANVTIDELLTGNKPAGDGKSAEMAELEAERQAVLDEFGEDSSAAKAIMKAMERLSKLEQGMTQQAHVAEARRIVGVLDGAISKHGLTGYGDAKGRTRANWEALEDLRKVASTIIDVAASRGRKISDDEAIAQADMALKGNKSGATETANKHKVLKERSAARTVPSGRSPSTTKKANPNADLDPNAPDYEARVYARSFR